MAKPLSNEAVWNALHRAFLTGDHESLNRLVRQLQPLLRRSIQTSFPQSRPDLVDDVVQDTLSGYAIAPHRVRSADSVHSFLFMSAWRKMATAVRAEKSRYLREARYAQSHVQETPQQPGYLFDAEIGADAHHSWHKAILRTASNSSERTAIIAWLTGQRRTGPLAIALGLSGVSLDEARKEVKRFKDRLLKRLSRMSHTFRVLLA